jgi:hypothetical protein
MGNISYSTLIAAKSREGRRLGGDGNATWNVIGGGDKNCIYNGANYASVLGGGSNHVSGSFSSILGGSGNSDGGFNYVGVFGESVTGVAPNTFHVECLNACATPIYTGPSPFPYGTIFAYNGATPPVDSYLLYVQL